GRHGHPLIKCALSCTGHHRLQDGNISPSRLRVLLTCFAMTSSQATLVRIETQDLSKAKLGKPSRPISGHTTYKTLESFSAMGGQLPSGVWEASAGAFRSHCAGYVEFCHIVEGSCRVVD